MIQRFKSAIVKKPSSSLIHGIRLIDCGNPDFHKALDQHVKYVDALTRMGLEVRILGPDEKYPDSCFIEDAAVITDQVGILTRPGIESRVNEPGLIKNELFRLSIELRQIKTPGTLDGGDIMQVVNHFYIGLSSRTNMTGALQFISILEQYNYTGSIIDVEEGLHLKSSVSYLENNILLVTQYLANLEIFKSFKKIIVSDIESYAANSLWINGTVLTPRGFPETKKNLLNLNFSIIELNMSEFQKLDGGLSCLSLRF